MDLKFLFLIYISKISKKNKIKRILVLFKRLYNCKKNFLFIKKKVNKLNC